MFNFDDPDVFCLLGLGESSIDICIPPQYICTIKDFIFSFGTSYQNRNKQPN